MEGDERLRLFCALLLPGETLDELVRWQAAQLAGARVRPVARDNLHVTLAFLGSTPANAMPGIADALRSAAEGIAPAVLAPVRYRETRSVSMIVHSDADGRATRLEELADQRWEGEKIAEEQFFYDPAQLAKK